MFDDSNDISVALAIDRHAMHIQIVRALVDNRKKIMDQLTEKQLHMCSSSILVRRIGKSYIYSNLFYKSEKNIQRDNKLIILHN